MGIDVEAVENTFEWETFKDGKPYLGTYRQEIPSMYKKSPTIDEGKSCSIEIDNVVAHTAYSLTNNSMLTLAKNIV